MGSYRKRFEPQYQYILDCMNPEGYEEATPEEKVKRFIELFVDEYNCPETVKRYPYIMSRIAEYLQGLPSACSIDFETYGIVKIGLEWGYISKEVDPDTQQEFYLKPSAAKFLKEWWSFISERIMEMVGYYGLTFPSKCYGF